MKASPEHAFVHPCSSSGRPLPFFPLFFTFLPLYGSCAEPSCCYPQVPVRDGLLGYNGVFGVAGSGSSNRRWHLHKSRCIGCFVSRCCTCLQRDRTYFFSVLHPAVPHALNASGLFYEGVVASRCCTRLERSSCVSPELVRRLELAPARIAELGGHTSSQALHACYSHCVAVVLFVLSFLYKHVFVSF